MHPQPSGNKGVGERGRERDEENGRGRAIVGIARVVLERRGEWNAKEWAQCFQMMIFCVNEMS